MSTPAEIRLWFLGGVRKQVYDYGVKLSKTPAELIDIGSLKAVLAELARDIRNKPKGAFDNLAGYPPEYSGLLKLAPQYLEVQLNSWQLAAYKEAKENLQHCLNALDRMIMLEQQKQRQAA